MASTTFNLCSGYLNQHRLHGLGLLKGYFKGDHEGCGAWCSFLGWVAKRFNGSGEDLASGFRFWGSRASGREGSWALAS